MAENFELLRNITIGQYIPTGSVIHRLDPRAKLVAAIVLMLAISFNSTLLPCALLVLIIMGIAWLARIPLTYLLRGLLLAGPLLAVLFLMQLVFRGWAEPAGYVYFEWWWFRVTQLSLQGVSVNVLRITGFIFITSLITMTSTTTELTHGVESLLAPFRRFGMPSHELALINMIALRFLPTLAEETERVMKAQASRGGAISGLRVWRPDIAARAYLPLLVPLFLNAFRRAEDLILAMEARCYVSGERRTKFVVLRSASRDWLAVAGVLILVLAVALWRWPSLLSIIGVFGFKSP